MRSFFNSDLNTLNKFVTDMSSVCNYKRQKTFYICKNKLNEKNEKNSSLLWFEFRFERYF